MIFLKLKKQFGDKCKKIKKDLSNSPELFIDINSLSQNKNFYI